MTAACERPSIVVSPWDCCWLPELQLQKGSGCIAFEARGDNDATLIIKEAPGGCRPQNNGETLAPVRGYIVIFGSHRNSCFKVERDGLTCTRVDGAPGVSGSEFRPFWLSLDNGVFTAGCGEPGCGMFHTWQDQHPHAGCNSVGLSTWDKHISFRNVRATSGLRQASEAPSLHQDSREQEQAGSLVQACCRSILQLSTPHDLTAALTHLHGYASSLPGFHEALLTRLAGHLPAAALRDPSCVQHLSVELMAALLQCPSLVGTERRIFEMVLLWAEQAGLSGADLDPVLPHVRFPLMTPHQLQTIRTDAGTAHSALLERLSYEADEVHKSTPLSPSMEDTAAGRASGPEPSTSGRDASEHVRETSAMRLRVRAALPSQDLTYLYCGDRNGVCHWLGTAGGTQEWVNPMLAGRLEVRASSPSCRSTEPHKLCGAQFSRTSVAKPQLGPRGIPLTWWQLDLGSHRLTCNCYMLRADGSCNYPRSWVLQGCLDAEHDCWVDLRRHENDTSLQMAGQSHAWPVGGLAAQLAFQKLRLVQSKSSAPQSAAVSHMCLSNFEFYGSLILLPAAQD